jgi:hypothetical protein
MCERLETPMKHTLAPVRRIARLTSNKRALVALGRFAGVLLLTSITATVTYAQVVVSVSATDADAAESPANPGEFVISSSAPPLNDVTIRYEVSGTATADDDYAALSGEVTLGPLQTSATIPVEVSGDDDAFEGDESVVVTLLDEGIVSIGNDTATVTIEDSEYALTVSNIANATEDPVSGGELRISLGASNESGAALTVDYTVTGTATAGVDYQPLSGTATIAQGTTSASIDITPLEDDEPEDDETVEVMLTNASDARVAIGDPASATVSIMDGDEEGTAEVIVSVSTTDDTARESPNQPGEFLVERVGGSNREVTIAYSVGGSATPGDDYDALSGSISLAEDETQATISVEPGNDDDGFEGDETVTITHHAIADHITVKD